MRVKVIFSLIIWFATCVFLSFKLAGSSSEAVMPLTWFLFCGIPIGLIVFGRKAHHRKYNKKEKGDFTVKQTHSAMKPTYEQADITLEHSDVEHAMPANQTRLQEKLKQYHSLFEYCQSVDEVIAAYMANNDRSIWLNIVEIELLRYYLQFSPKFKNQTWIRSDLADKISAASNGNSNYADQFLDIDIFSTFVIDDRQQNSQYKKEPIKRSEHLEASIDALLIKMRKITNERSYYFSNADIFIEQGKFMEEFTDNYKENVPFQEYYPTYSSMNNKQLRTYLTWRTGIRNGELIQTSLSYVFVYIYELINNIGVENPLEGIEKLSWLLKNHSKFGTEIKKYLVQWIKDYYVCNVFNISFKEIVKKYKLENYYPAVVTPTDNNKYSFRKLSTISKYKIEDSKFFSEENKEYIMHCFDKVICNMTPLLSLYGTDFDELISGEGEVTTWWKPFHGAVYRETKGKDKKTIIANNEIYELKDGQWLAYKPPQYSNVAAFVFGYIIKKIESDLRVLTNYRYKLSPNIGSLQEQIRGLYAVTNKIICVISDTAFEEIIDETTKLEFLAISTKKENAEVPFISKKISGMLKEEPYFTFIKMRNADELKGETNTTKRFHIQAGILDNLTDDYETMIPFDSPMPIFDTMSNSQLRCYVTWRSKVRNGEYPEIPISYIRLYISELINKKGEADEKIIGELAAIFKNYRNYGGNLGKMLTACIKDYYICGDILKPFHEILKENNMIQYYPNVFMEYSEAFNAEGFRQISNYDISKSKFYSEQTASIINGCFQYVFEDVERYFSNRDLNLRQIITGKGYAKKWWEPFKDILCNKEPKSNRRVVICSNEAYSFKGKEWTCELMPEKDNTGAVLIGYMFKRMEVNMRTILKFKYKLSAEPTAIAEKIMDQQISSAVKNPVFSQTIDDSVIRYFKEKHPRLFVNPNVLFEKPVEVKIDISKLNKIREDAEIIRDKLTIEDESDEILFDMEQAKNNITNKSLRFNSPLEELCSSITEIQKKALIVMLNESSRMSAIMELAKTYHVMPEMLFDEINETALGLIGDNLIETADENPYIYDDYLNEIKMYLEEKNDGESSS